MQGGRQPRDTDLTDSDICNNKHKKKTKKKNRKWNNIIKKITDHRIR